jgi:hypothetical protein
LKKRTIFVASLCEADVNVFNVRVCTPVFDPAPERSLARNSLVKNDICNALISFGDNSYLIGKVMSCGIFPIERSIEIESTDEPCIRARVVIAL